MPEARIELPGSHHDAPEGMRVLGPTPIEERVTVSVYLKDDGDMPPIQDAGEQIASRASLRSIRTEDHADDVAAVKHFAAEYGLQVQHVDEARRLVQLTGPIGDVQRAFGTELHQYEHANGVVRGRSGALHLPASVADRIDAVLGLDTTPIASPKIVPHRGPAPERSFLPTEVATLYGVGGLDASGQCVAIIELGGKYTASDNEAAFGAMGLSVPEIVSVAVDRSGGGSHVSSAADGEVALDIQVVGGVARGAKLAVYFAPNTSQGFVDAISQAVHDDTNRPSVISISWGSPEAGWSGQALKAMNSALQDAARLGITVAAASGDALATDGRKDGKAHVDYPASNPYVLGCGGTRIEATGDDLTSEVVWNSHGGGTGGGTSNLFAKPSYQAGVSVPRSSTTKGGRGVPDVCGNADPDSGYRIVTDGQTGVIGGTSAVAPLWAGIIACANARRNAPVGFVHPALYDNASALRDVVDGDNKADGIGYVAATGWDACTGLGSPTAAILKLLGKDA